MKWYKDDKKLKSKKSKNLVIDYNKEEEIYFLEVRHLYVYQGTTPFNFCDIFHGKSHWSKNSFQTNPFLYCHHHICILVFFVYYITLLYCVLLHLDTTITTLYGLTI